MNELFLDWSPDGSQLAVVNSIVGESVDGGYPPITSTLWLVPAAGGEASQLGTFSIVPMEHSRHALQWSPDGTAISVAMSMPNVIFHLSGEQTTLLEGSLILAWVPGQSNLLLVQDEMGLALRDAQSLEVVQPITTAGPPPQPGRFPQMAATWHMAGSEQ